MYSLEDCSLLLTNLPTRIVTIRPLFSFHLCCSCCCCCFCSLYRLHMIVYTLLLRRQVMKWNISVSRTSYSYYIIGAFQVISVENSFQHPQSSSYAMLSHFPYEYDSSTNIFSTNIYKPHFFHYFFYAKVIFLFLPGDFPHLQQDWITNCEIVE